MEERTSYYGIAVDFRHGFKVLAVHDPLSLDPYVVLCDEPRTMSAVTEVLVRLEKMQYLPRYSVFVPFLCIEVADIRMKTWYDGAFEQHRGVEKKAQIYTFTSDWNDAQPTNEALVEFTRELAKLQSQFGSVKFGMEQAAGCLDVMKTMHRVYAEQERLIHRAQTQTDWNEMVQASMQTVCRKQISALIGNKDCQLNYEASMASLKIAKDSRKVAILAREDSTDMRVIADATLVFLPATFFVALFSTDFFNFEPSTGLVNRWILVYFVVTAVLSAAVMLTWRHWLKICGRETEKLITAENHAANEQRSDCRDSGTIESFTSSIVLQALKNKLSRRRGAETVNVDGTV